MQQVVTITSQGQLTIPKSIREQMNIKNSSKALIKREGQKIIVEPRSDFWSLESILSSAVTLSDSQLREARKAFTKSWSKHA